MYQNPLSPAVPPRPGGWAAPDGFSPSRPSAGAEPSRLLPPTDARLLGLLGEHQVLTTGHLVRLTGLPERTVQHRLGRLERAGLLNRLRPQVPIGTAPYHCWLTTFGAAAVGAAAPESWDHDPASLRAAAALSDLWLGVRDRGPEMELELCDWRRLPSGASFRDARTGTLRQVPVEGEVLVTRGAEVVSAFVLTRVEQVPLARLVAIVGRFAGYFATLPGTASPPVLLVLARTVRLANTVRVACGQVPDAAGARRLDPRTVDAAIRRVAVGVIEPRPAGLVADAVWHTATGDHAYRLAEILTSTAWGSR